MNAQIQKLLAAGKITPEQATKYTARIQEQLQKKNAELTKRYTEQTARLSTNTCK
jgi:polyhydroxyalkanoate synthesis regulator phasin